LGIKDSAGFSSNADEIKIAYAHFEGTVIEPKRKKLTTSFGYILKLSGFNVKIEVYPNKLLAMPENEAVDAPKAAENPDVSSSPEINIPL